MTPGRRVGRGAFARLVARLGGSFCPLAGGFFLFSSSPGPWSGSATVTSARRLPRQGVTLSLSLRRCRQPWHGGRGMDTGIRRSAVAARPRRASSSALCLYGTLIQHVSCAMDVIGGMCGEDGVTGDGGGGTWPYLSSLFLQSPQPCPKRPPRP